MCIQIIISIITWTDYIFTVTMTTFIFLPNINTTKICSLKFILKSLKYNISAFTAYMPICFDSRVGLLLMHIWWLLPTYPKLFLQLFFLLLSYTKTWYVLKPQSNSPPYSNKVRRCHFKKKIIKQKRFPLKQLLKTTAKKKMQLFASDINTQESGQLLWQSF